LQDHAQRIADQQHIDAAAREQRGEGGVIGGQYAELFATGFHLRQGGDRDRFARVVGGGRRGVAGHGVLREAWALWCRKRRGNRRRSVSGEAAGQGQR